MEKVFTSFIINDLFSHSVVSDSFWPQGLQHARHPCHSPFPRVCSNSCPLSQWCHPTILSSVIAFSSDLRSVFLTIRVFSNESVLRIRRPKYWSFSFNISPSDEYSGLISFRSDWLDLLAVQRTLMSSSTSHSKTCILWWSAFFMVQLSHPFMTTWKTIALTRRTCVSKVMSLLFNMPSRFVIAFLPRSKCLLISWQQLPSAVIWESKKLKSLTVSTVTYVSCSKRLLWKHINHRDERPQALAWGTMIATSHFCFLLQVLKFWLCWSVNPASLSLTLYFRLHSKIHPGGSVIKNPPALLES